MVAGPAPGGPAALIHAEDISTQRPRYFSGAVYLPCSAGKIGTMPAKTHIDTEATAAALATVAEQRMTAIAGTDITLPQGQYVSGTNAIAAGLIATRLADLARLTTAGGVAAQTSVATYETTEQANAATLTT